VSAWVGVVLRQVQDSNGSGEGGFAAVDALVAVTILASSLSLSLVAAQIAARASKIAAETKAAEILLRERLVLYSGRPGIETGEAGGLSWRLEATRSRATTARIIPCSVSASARSKRTGRVYQINALELCSAPAAQ